MEKYEILYKKETKDKKYHTNPFRPINFRVDENGTIRCPNDRGLNLSIDIWSEGTYTAGRRKYLNAKTAKDARWQSNVKRPRRTKESH